MTTSLFSVIIGVFVLGILVFLHEFGHFLAAKACKIRVLTFSLGFGSALFSKTWGGTEYRVSTIPFGGYVKMAGENPDEDREGEPDEFPSRPVWQRAIVAVAGPLANFVSAFGMLWIMFVYGVDRPVYYERPVIGYVADSSAAQNAGIEAGDSIVSIDGRGISDWDDIEAVMAQQERQYDVELVRNDGRISAQILLTQNKGSVLPKHPFGGLLPPLPAIVADTISGSAAATAGVLPGDSVVAIDGRPIHSWYQLVNMVQGHRLDTPMVFSVARKGSTVDFAILPRFDSTENRPVIGIKPSEGKVRRVRYAAIPALGRSVDKAWEYTTMIFDVIGKLVSRQVSTEQLSGPIGIIPASGFIALQGLGPLLNFMALIGINLAVLNLFPLVITDGGLLVFLIIEAFRGKPLPVKTQLLINKIAVAFIVLLFLYVTFNDVKRLPEYFRIFSR